MQVRQHAAMREVTTKFFANRLVTLVDPVAGQQLRIGVVEQHREVRGEDLVSCAARLRQPAPDHTSFRCHLAAHD